MAIITERILQSSSLEANKALIAAREMGLTADTERPIIGTTTGGPKFIGTEDLISIIIPAPAALALLRRSRVMCFVDTNAAGANVALDIQAGAQSAGYSIKVFVSGPDTRQAIVTYGIGLIEYIPAGISQEFVWDGSKWNKTLMSWADRYEICSLVESVIDETPSAKKPYLKLWDSDHVLDIANAPLAISKLRAEKVSVWSGSAYVTDHSVTVSGSTITGSGTAWDALLAGLAEDILIHGGYTNYRPMNINGVDYAITNVTAGSHTATVSGTPASGSQTAIIYARRIAGSTTTARTYKESGRALMSQDGTLRIAGLRRRHHVVGHYHGPLSPATTFVGARSGGSSNLYSSGGVDTPASTGAAITDGIYTPNIGPEDEPNSSTVYRALWLGVLL